MITLVTGGSGSGKSQYAEQTAVDMKEKTKAGRLYYFAAMKPFGAEAAERIERHRRQREGKGFETIENYTAKMPDIDGDSVVLLECMSNLTANEIFDCGNQNAEKDIIGFISELEEKVKALVIVTNEIFSDGVRYDSGTLHYIEVLGRINRQTAEKADVIVELVSGIPVRLKG